MQTTVKQCVIMRMFVFVCCWAVFWLYIEVWLSNVGCTLCS